MRVEKQTARINEAHTAHGGAFLACLWRCTLGFSPPLGCTLHLSPTRTTVCKHGPCRTYMRRVGVMCVTESLLTCGGKKLVRFSSLRRASIVEILGIYHGAILCMYLHHTDLKPQVQARVSLLGRLPKVRRRNMPPCTSGYYMYMWDYEYPAAILFEKKYLLFLPPRPPGRPAPSWWPVRRRRGTQPAASVHARDAGQARPLAFPNYVTTATTARHGPRSPRGLGVRARLVLAFLNDYLRCTPRPPRCLGARS